MSEKVLVNRAPVLTLWASVVAERLGFDRDAALTLGKCLAGLNAQSKGRRLGIFKPRDSRKAAKAGLGEEFWVELCGRPVPAKSTDDGVRAVVKDKPVDPAGVREYLHSKFGNDLATVRKAMEQLAKAFDKDVLTEKAYSLYEQFRPEIPSGRRGWGAKGELDLAMIRSLGQK
jgi:hypothetical protein